MDPFVIERHVVLYSKLANQMFPNRELTDDQLIALNQTAAILQVAEKLEKLAEILS